MSSQEKYGDFELLRHLGKDCKKRLLRKPIVNDLIVALNYNSDNKGGSGLQFDNQYNRLCI